MKGSRLKTPILVTGASGFLGRCLVERLRREGVDPSEIVALGRGTDAADAGRRVIGDVRDRSSLIHAIEIARPYTVFHLAGRTPPASEDEFVAVNSQGTTALLGAIATLDRPTRVVCVGSAAEIGPTESDELPSDEDCRCAPVEPYGKSKLAATRAALAAPEPLDVSVARVFNPIGPGLPESQAFGRFVAILARSRETPIELTVGDLSPKRDFIDARDVAEALVAIAERGRSGRLYNVATGRSRSIEEGLAELIRRSGRAVAIVEDPSRTRRAGPSDSRGDVSRIATEVGFRPRIPWETSLSDMWADARARFGSD